MEKITFEINKEQPCQICRELIKKIELAHTTYEAIEYENLIHRHKYYGACNNEKAVA